MFKVFLIFVFAVVCFADDLPIKNEPVNTGIDCSVEKCPPGESCIDKECYRSEASDDIPQATKIDENSIAQEPKPNLDNLTEIGPCIGGGCPLGAKCYAGACYGQKEMVDTLAPKPENQNYYYREQAQNLERMFKQMSDELVKINQQLTKLLKVKPTNSRNPRITRRNGRNIRPKYNEINQ
uniref:Secreted protein n=1 Tax=Acrobeloides nanus TaxID=290746 RepID=A0A914CDM6_9BILA